MKDFFLVPVEPQTRNAESHDVMHIEVIFFPATILLCGLLKSSI